jgi:two-component system, chemotaxis family, CheB/CheR fusion protein
VSPDRSFPVVGIGASAGGVEAFEGFFRNMPADTGMAFVLVTHMPPGYETTLPEILSRYTDMPVSSIRNDEAIEPDHVYVCPSAHVVVIKDGSFSLASRQSGHERKPIDIFLSSLAVALTENAIGVVLSGGGSDGALGIRAIKQHGGLTLAQGSDGSGPRQTSMPEAAIATGVVDLVLPVESMPARLVEFARSRRDDDVSAPGEQGADGAAESPELRRQIAQLLHAQVGHDFSGYKEKSFMRRVRRRMHILQLSDLAAYVQLLEKQPDEIKLLFRDLLIGVTNFFRDQEAFDALKEQVIPKLFEGLGAADSVRIWVPGCATGEEAYSIAILVREQMQSLKAIPTVQIFSTDIDDAALSVARRGRYPHALMENLAPERLARFFVRDDVSYTVVKELRDLCIFSLHSVLRDPPFSRIDLISCRNLLIYLGAEFQGRVIPIFHVALRPRGYLFLGTSESISQYSDLFQRIDNKQRLFQRRDHVSSPFPLTFGAGARAAVSGIAVRREPAATASGLRAAVENRVMDSFAPPHVVVNRDGDIVYYSSRTGRYLEAAAGMPSRQLLPSARRGLRLDLRHAFQEALESRRPAVREGVAVEIDDHIQTVRITVEPIGTHESDPLFLVVFSDVGRPQLPAEMTAVRRAGDGSVEQLERELRDTRDRLQVTVEEYEASLEEMKSGNEEMVSVNEELQSTNEELETSKEELQSVNEELQTVNSELNSKVEELDRANADLRNLFETTQVGTIFLDNQLVIRSFTPAATSVFNLISTDRGRPLTDIVSRFDYDGFEREIRSVLERGETIERRVHRSDGKSHYLMRILPYRGRNNATEGVVVTFFDVTKLAEAEQQQRTLMEELNHRVRNMLTVVTAIAQAAHARSESPEHFITSFTARIRAMAATYNLLSRQSWGDVALRDVLEVVIEPYRRNNEDRFKLEGPAVLLKPKAVLAFGLAAHELVANAAKYGALSNDKGTVSIDWQQQAGDGSALLLRWREADGPAVKKPSRKGLGSELIEREIKNMLRGTATFDYAPAGLEVVLSMPVGPSIVA